MLDGKDIYDLTHIAIIDKDSPHRSAFIDDVRDNGADYLARMYELINSCPVSHVSNKEAGIIAKHVLNEMFDAVKESIKS